jgi:hypothetical protein
VNDDPSAEEPEPSDGTTPLTFDRRAYLSVFGPGDPEGAAWLSGYVEGTQANCAELARLVALPPDAPGRAEGLRSVAHRIAGTSFDSGAVRLGEAARALENTPPDQPLNAHLNAVIAAFSSTRTAITAFLKTQEQMQKAG